MECGYEDTSSGAFGWDNLVAGSISNSPNVDHTTNSSTGHYMFVDHTDNLFGETAVLTGPQMGRTSSLCSLELWYHMSGDRSQTLILYSMVSSSFPFERPSKKWNYVGKIAKWGRVLTQSLSIVFSIQSNSKGQTN